MTGGWITQADRARWQRQAAAELASILGHCDGLPLITWTVSPSGGSLCGRITGPAPTAGVRGVFTAWQEALGMGDVLETAVASGTRLRARGWRGGVRVTVTATIPGGEGTT